MDEKLREALDAKNELGDALDGTTNGKDDPVFLAFCRLEKALNALRATPQAGPVSVPKEYEIAGRVEATLANLEGVKSWHPITASAVARDIHALLTAAQGEVESRPSDKCPTCDGEKWVDFGNGEVSCPTCHGMYLTPSTSPTDSAKVKLDGKEKTR